MKNKGTEKESMNKSNLFAVVNKEFSAMLFHVLAEQQVDTTSTLPSNPSKLHYQTRKRDLDYTAQVYFLVLQRVDRDEELLGDLSLLPAHFHNEHPDYTVPVHVLVR